MIRYPKAIRPWQHVLDPTYGYIKLAEKCSIIKIIHQSGIFIQKLTRFVL